MCAPHKSEIVCNSQSPQVGAIGLIYGGKKSGKSSFSCCDLHVHLLRSHWSAVTVGSPCGFAYGTTALLSSSFSFRNRFSTLQSINLYHSQGIYCTLCLCVSILIASVSAVARGRGHHVIDCKGIASRDCNSPSCKNERNAEKRSNAHQFCLRGSREVLPE